MARVASYIAFIAMMCALVGCRERPVEPANVEVFQVPYSRLVISQMNSERVVARDIGTGELVWEYVREPVQQPSYATRPTPTVVCPMIWLPVGMVVLRFDDAMHAVGVETGRLIWTQHWGNRRFCPVAGLDSGVLSISQWGEAIEKLNASGEPVWEYRFSAQGAAIAMPTVVSPTGDVLVRTRHHLLNVSPHGTLNWSVPHSVELEPPP